MAYTPSADQSAYIAELLAMAKGKKLLLQAEGGCGKTTSTAFAIAELLKQDAEASIACIAPTHRAKMQLFSQLTSFLTLQQLKQVHCFTSARFTGLGLKENLPTGQLDKFYTAGGLYTDNWRLVIADEVSMIQKAELNRLLSTDNTTVFMGDEAQAKPVRGKLSSIFCETFRKEHDITCLELTINHRQDLTLYNVGHPTRTREHYPDSNSSANQVHDSREALVSAFLDKARNEPFGDFAYLAFTNKQVNETTKLYREQVLNSPNAWLQGERLRIISHPKLNNGDLATIKAICHTLQEVVHGVSFIVQEAIIQDEEGDTHFMKLLAPGQEAKLAEARAYFQSEGDKAMQRQEPSTAAKWWRLRSGLSDAFDTATSAMCCTVLKSQGSTIDTVFVDTKDIKRYGTSKKHLLYVAFSRASRFIHSIHIDNKLSPAHAFRKHCKTLGIKQLRADVYAKQLAKPGWSEQKHIEYWTARK